MKKFYFITGLLLLCVIIYNCSQPKNTVQNQVPNPYPTRVFDSTPSIEYLNTEVPVSGFTIIAPVATPAQADLTGVKLAVTPMLLFTVTTGTV